MKDKPQVRWCENRRGQEKDFAKLLAQHFGEPCEHTQLGHCRSCVAEHLEDLIAYVYEHF